MTEIKEITKKLEEIHQKDQGRNSLGTDRSYTDAGDS